MKQQFKNEEVKGSTSSTTISRAAVLVVLQIRIKVIHNFLNSFITV